MLLIRPSKKYNTVLVATLALILSVGGYAYVKYGRAVTTFTSVDDSVTGSNNNQFQYFKTDGSLDSGSTIWQVAGNDGLNPPAGKFNAGDRYSYTTGSYYQVKFNGTGIKLYATTNAHHGIATITIDGNQCSKSKDFYSASVAYKVKVYDTDVDCPGPLTLGVHTLKVLATGTKNPSATGTTITADYVRVGVYDPPPSINSFTATPNPAYKGQMVRLQVDASDAEGVNWVEIWEGTNLIGTASRDSGSPTSGIYHLDWYTHYSDITVGNHTFEARASDNAQTTTSAPLVVTLNATGSDTTPPSPPTNLTGSAISANEVSLSYTPSTDNPGGSGVTSYRVFRNGAALGSPLPANANGYTDTSTVCGLSYTYYIKAKDLAGNESGPSNSHTVTTPACPPDTTPPNAPTNFNAVVASPTQVNTSWTYATDNPGGTGVAQYQVLRDAVVISTVDASGGVTINYSDTAALCGQTYSYKVKAKDAVGNLSASSNVKSVTMPACTDSIPPNAPTNFNAVVASPTQVNTSWTAATDNTGGSGIKSYRVTRTRILSRAPAAIFSVNAPATSLADPTAQCGQVYNYYVHAVDNANNQGPISSNKIVFTAACGDTEDPSAPTTFTATPEPLAGQPLRVKLAWGASTDNVGVTKYRIYRDSASFQDVPVSTLNYLDTAVSCGTSRAYFVTAFDAAGNESAASTQANAAPDCTDQTDPAWPAGAALTATASPNGQPARVDLSWPAATDNHPGATGINHYLVFRGGQAIANLSVNSLSYTDTSVSDSTSYNYEVQAFDGADNFSVKLAKSVTTNASADTTKPNPPTNLAATATSATQVDLTWTAATDNPGGTGVVGYNIARKVGAGTYIPIGTSLSTSFGDATVSPNTAYTYQVMAVDGNNNVSDPSNTASVTTPQETTQPNVSVTAPANGATVSGTVSVTATASDPSPSTGIVQVEFLVAQGSGTGLVFNPLPGSPDLTSPYQVSWITNGFANGTWSVLARATDGAGNSSESLIVVTVNNQIATPCNTSPTPPAFDRVVWIWMARQTYADVLGPSAVGTDYQKQLRDQCGYSTNYTDNTFSTTDLSGLPHALAVTSGSNCVTGLTGVTTSNSACITADNEAGGASTLSTVPIFKQVKDAGKTWKAYIESMGGSCQPTLGGDQNLYSPRHNPPPYYTQIGADCNSLDISIPTLTCTASACPVPPSSQLLTDINNGTLPNFAFIAPNICNNQRSCAPDIADEWLKVYLKKILEGPNYQTGRTAVFVLWDEVKAGQPLGPLPNLIISPSTNARSSALTMNHFAILRISQKLLNLTPYLGCATGTVPGTSTPCPTGSLAGVKAAFNL